MSQLTTDARRARNGLVPGGGVAFLRAARALDNAAGQDETAAEILAAALEQPARVLLRSAGADEDEMVRKMMAAEEPVVYDVIGEKLVPARQSTILDPASTILQTLETAVSLVSVILTGSVLDLKAGEKAGAGEGARCTAEGASSQVADHLRPRFAFFPGEVEQEIIRLRPVRTSRTALSGGSSNSRGSVPALRSLMSSTVRWKTRARMASSMNFDRSPFFMPCGSMHRS